MEEHIKYLYSIIYKSWKECNDLEIQSSIINLESQIPQQFFSSSSLLSENIKNDILNNSSYKYQCQKKIKNKTINICFISMKHVSHDKIKEYFDKCYLWLNMIIYSNCNIHKCCNNLDIVIALTNKKKILPKNSNIVLSSEHINTGYTYTCKINNEIIIYRKEEWLKVFIHETFHAFDLDGSSLYTLNSNYDSKIKEIFNIKNKIALYESYCEVWARILNILIYNFYDNNMLSYDSNKFYKKTVKLIQQEAVFSVIQSSKILKFMGLDYNILISKDESLVRCSQNLYKENTHVFCYYILTSLLLLNLDSFLNWCNQHNSELFCFTKTSKNINNFINLIFSLYNKKELIKIYNNAFNQPIYNDSLRMTHIE
jgi:uncharacterized protein YacL (UPF0231 family)